MSIRIAGTITRNPAQQRPLALPERRDRKLGPGTLRTPADITGPPRFTPLINAQAQSARSNAATFAPQSINRLDALRSRVIDRASIALPSAYSDDAAGGVAIP